MNGEKIKVLLVEDEALNYVDIQQFLQDEGFKVLSLPGKIIIDNYDDAVAVCENEIPHIAILDIQIKGEKDGLDIAAYIRENYYSPVIILSSHATSENIRRAALLSVDGFTKKIEKPYNLEQLRVTLNLLLSLAVSAAKRREENIFLSVKGFSEQGEADASFGLKRLALNELLFVKTLPDNKNYVLLEMNNAQKYVCHKSLKDLADLLPLNFIRFTGNRIINTDFIDRKSNKSQWVYFIGNNRFEIADIYRTDELKTILKKLKL
ncbi:MAG: response regulator [Ferruginibacter sp.]|nr:response regulator [Ferruginibacter sp.]